MPPDPIRQPKPASPPNQVHLAGRGLALSGPADMPVSVRSLDADVIDLTPNDPLTLTKGQLDIRLHQADLAVPADRLAAFIQGQLHTRAVQNFKLSFKAPNQAIATGTATIGGKPTPIRLEGQLLAVNGRLGFKPTHLSTQISGFDMRWRPQDGRAEVDATDTQLMALLLPKLKSNAVSNVAWQIQPNNQVHATATVQIAKRPAALDLQAELAAQDGQLAVLARHAKLDWRGLTMEADPLDRKAQIRGSQEAVTQIIRDELDIDRIRGMDFKFHPGNRISATGEVLESGAWRPVSIEGRLEAKDGALRIVPETATIQDVKGGLDITAHPQTGQAEAAITEQALNDLLGPLAAKKGFENLKIRLLDGNRVHVDGEKVDAEHPDKRKRVSLEGHLVLNGDGAVRFDFEKARYGAIGVNFHSLPMKLLGSLGIHVDDFLKLDAPVAKVKKDSLYFYPGAITDRIQGRLDNLQVSAGQLKVAAATTTDLRTLVPFKNERFTFDGKAFSITPATISDRAAGTVTGVSTGEGTITLDAAITPADLRHIVDLKSGTVDYQGDRLLVSTDKIQDKVPGGQVVGVKTSNGKATAEVALDGAAVAKLLPKLPDGVAFNGRMLTMKPETIDKNVHASITGVSVENGQVRLRVGDGAPPGSGNQLDATSHGKLTVSGITIEDADVSLTDKTPGTPLNPKQLGDGTLSVRRGKAFIPRDRVESLMAQALTPDKLKGFQVAYAKDGMAAQGAWHGIPITGKVKVAGGGTDGLGLSLSGVKLAGVPLPDRFATWLVGKLAKLPSHNGRLTLDVGGQAGIKLGPLQEVRAEDDGLHVAIGP